MKCNECQEALSAYYDEILDQEQTAAVAAHLERCQTCKEEYEQLRMILGCLTNQQEEIVVPHLLHEQMLDKVAKEAQKEKVKHLWPQRVGGMVAALLVGVILIKMNPLEINEMTTSDESYTSFVAQASENGPTQTAAGISSETDSGDVAKARMAPNQQESERETAPQQMMIDESGSSEMLEDEITVQNERSSGNEMQHTEESLETPAVRTIVDEQLWEIETHNIEDLTKYLEDYTESIGAKVEMIKEEEYFMLYGITDANALFEALQAQNFTKSIINIDETGKNIKIVIKA